MRPCTKLSGTVVQLNRSCTKRFRFACWKVRYSILETCDPPVTPHGAALCLWNSACQPFSHASAGDSAAVQTQRRREHMVTRRDVFFGCTRLGGSSCICQGTTRQFNISCTTRLLFPCWKVKNRVFKTCARSVISHGAKFFFTTTCQCLSQLSLG